MLVLTGTPQQVKEVARAFRVYASNTNETAEDDMDYLVDHSIVMYLVGPDGSFVDFYPQITESAEVVKRITSHVTAAAKRKQ